MESGEETAQHPVLLTAGLKLGAEDGEGQTLRLAVEIEFQPDGMQTIERTGGIGPAEQEVSEVGRGDPFGQGRCL